MKIFYRPNAKFTVEFEPKNVQELFQELGPLQEVLSEAEKCGKCGCTDVKFNHRKVDGNDFYELICGNNKCRAKLSLGTERESKNLFPRRYEQDPDDPKKPLMRDGKKVWLPDGGWVRWDANLGKNV